MMMPCRRRRRPPRLFFRAGNRSNPDVDRDRCRLIRSNRIGLQRRIGLGHCFSFSFCSGAERVGLRLRLRWAERLW